MKESLVMTKLRHEQNPWFLHRTTCGAAPWLAGAVFCSALFSGCVSVEKYEAEKARALNFQRLLAQEENRADELNSQLQETQVKMESLASKKDELAMKVDALQEQRRHGKTGASSSVAGGAAESGEMSFSESSLSELGLPDLSFEESAFQDFDGERLDEPVYHTVVSGETLYRLSRNYGVTIAQLKKWNNLTGNIIVVGQRLVVSTP